MPDMPRRSPTFFLIAEGAGVDITWHPRADIYHTRDGWLVKLELAGVRAEDLTIRARGSRLTVSGAYRGKRCRGDASRARHDGREPDMSEQDTIQTLPVLPIKNTVLFPHLQMPLSIGRPASIAAVETAMASEEKQIIVVAQRDATVDTPTQDDLYTIGTIAIIKKM